MSPDDPRHGTYAGSIAHASTGTPTCIPCRVAGTRYMKRRRLRIQNGQQLSMPMIGSQRRIQALMALGWTASDIATTCGWSDRSSVLQILTPKPRAKGIVRTTTADKLAEAYDSLSMRLPTLTSYRSRVRNLARNRGYLPPLAWEGIDIDDPDAQPWQPEQQVRSVGRTSLIEALVEDFDWLVSQGESEQQAAERLGIRLDSFKDQRRRLERQEVA